jgi:hypothetical protein
MGILLAQVQSPVCCDTMAAERRRRMDCFSGLAISNAFVLLLLLGVLSTLSGILQARRTATPVERAAWRREAEQARQDLRVLLPFFLVALAFGCLIAWAL